MENRKKLLEVKNLKKYYPVRTGFIKKTELKAVDDVSFFIRKGETLGIVGESGCGKSTLGKSILRLEEPTAGDILYDGTSIMGKNMKEYRTRMQIVFQDPYASLDPRKTVSDLIGEAMDLQNLCSSKAEPHTSGELIWILFYSSFRLIDTNQCQQFQHSFFPCLRIQAGMLFQGFIQLIFYCKQWIQGCHGILKDHSNFISPKLLQLLPGHFQNIFSVK